MATLQTPELRVEFRGEDLYGDWIALADDGRPITDLIAFDERRRVAMRRWRELPPAKCACASGSGANGDYFACVAVDPATGHGHAQCWLTSTDTSLTEHTVEIDPRKIREFIVELVDYTIGEGDELLGATRDEADSEILVHVLRTRRRGVWRDNGR